MVDAFGGSRIKLKPPERGVFPLDHDGECKSAMKTYISCLNSNQSDHYKCRDLSKSYLKCRMENSLMAEENLDNLGFSTEDPTYNRVFPVEGEKEKNGFVAGTGVAPSKKWFFS